MRPRSLALRLVLASAAWVSAAVIVSGVLLVVLFRDHIERRFTAVLFDHLQELVAASEAAPNGALVLNWTPSDPRFNLPLSGWYWAILKDGRAVHRSRSLLDAELPVAGHAARPGPHARDLTGPDGTRLRVIVEDITFPEYPYPFTFVLAGPESDVERDVREFAWKLAATLGLLAAGLVAAVYVQVRFGLRPLRALRDQVAQIRAGTLRRLPGNLPAEIEPLANEVNDLLGHTDEMVKRARRETGDLAHALKTPLTVIRNEARRVEGEPGAIISEQTAAISGWLDRFLSRARTAATRRVLGARSEVAPVVADLRFSMARLYGERGLEVHADGLEGLCFRGDAQDLTEMVGNLLDNACKWARREIWIEGRREDETLRIRIEDDGPGVPEERLEEIVQRGVRLDERSSGAGLGLDIVRDIADLYGGSLTLGRSPRGGLRAALELPAAP